MSTAPDEVPAAFTRHFRQSPLTDPWEPLYSKVGDGVVVLGVRIRQAHCNGKGFLHGGLIGALADNAMGLSVIETLNRKGIDRSRNGSTITLAVDFLAHAQVGQWLEVVPRVLQLGRTIAFVECLVLADTQPIARGNATFRIFREQRHAAD